MIVKELTELEFKEFTDRYPYSSIFQTVECAKTMQEEGYKIMYIGAIESGKIIPDSSLCCSTREARTLPIPIP